MFAKRSIWISHLSGGKVLVSAPAVDAGNPSARTRARTLSQAVATWRPPCATASSYAANAKAKALAAVSPCSARQRATLAWATLSVAVSAGDPQESEWYTRVPLSSNPCQRRKDPKARLACSERSRDHLGGKTSSLSSRPSSARPHCAAAVSPLRASMNGRVEFHAFMVTACVKTDSFER